MGAIVATIQQLSSRIQWPLLRSPWPIWSALSLLSTSAIMSEKTAIGSMLSAPVVTTLCALVLSNLGVIPSVSPVYDCVLKQLVPLAIPLLLFDADIRKCLRATGSLMKAFIIGSVGSIIGTFASYWLVPMRHIPGSEKIAAALCARHIGGAVNFVAVSDILKPPVDAVTAALAADNVVVALYFMFLFAISVPDRVQSKPSSKQREVVKELEEVISQATNTVESTSSTANSEITLESLSKALSLSLFLYALSDIIGTATGTSPMIIVSLLSVFVATVFPVSVGSISRAGGILGVLIMQMFFAVIGAMGNIATVMSFGPSLFIHTAVQIAVHFAISVGIGKVFNIPFKEIVLASNANVGGPTTAAAMAASKRWNNLILPALLTGVFGYAIATGIGLIVAKGLTFCIAKGLIGTSIV